MCFEKVLTSYISMTASAILNLILMEFKMVLISPKVFNLGINVF